jgi:hypothetical protein
MAFNARFPRKHIAANTTSRAVESGVRVVEVRS